MITELNINNYKVYKQASLQLKGLNVLTGENSSGKSSIIQSLLLLRQSSQRGNMEGLQLQGDLCNVGLVDDAICQYADKDTITFSLRLEDGQFLEWNFAKKDNNGFQNMIPIVGNEPLSHNCSLFTSDFQYIGASRLEPQESYPLDTGLVEVKRQLSSRYGKCDLVAHFLYHYGVEQRQIINSQLKYESVEDFGLISQVSAWERIISKGVNVSPQKEGRAFVLKYSFNKPNDIVGSNAFNATNVGYGLSYALPIIVAVLSSQPGSLLLIENPEIHLHPHGQSELAKLLARAAQLGIQIIVETHSDHIINGILVAAKQFEEIGEGIDRENIQIFNCKKNEDTQIGEITPISVLEGGKIDIQPDGFFDQTEKDLSYLLGF